MATFESVEGSRAKEDGALYLVEDRLQTFRDWPFETGPCTSLKVTQI